MQLSIVIVSYNVRYFLEQCLLSVERATQGMAAETWVVDNNSADGSVEMVRRRFPWVRVIANSTNPGFSIANNQAIRASSGDYVLLLNPDTVVGEQTLEDCYRFAVRNPKLGGLGVKMIDGSGRFLPESKRGLPTPWVAFTKAFGLARLFPHSRRFGQYHLGYLAADTTHEVEVLAGAFMWLSKRALGEVGLLDEAFFMYGEDIDLSHRLVSGGYCNFYFAAASIIHYKGESTKRGSLNYVRVFYQAMIIFARKHFVGSRARLLVWMMQLAVYLRATLTVVGHLWQRLRFPLVDAVGIYLGLRFIKRLWASYHFGDPTYFPDYVDYVHFPAYVLLWTGGLFLGGGYDRPYDAGRLLKSLAISTVLLLAIYGLLPEMQRPSRALLVLGAAWTTIWTLAVRTLAGSLRTKSGGEGRLLIVGGAAETERALSLLQRAGARRNFVGRIGRGDDAVGKTYDLPELVSLYRCDELIFCTADLAYDDLIEWMVGIGPGVQYRILPQESNSIIGSHHSDRRGSLYTVDIDLRIDDPTNRRAKWLFDRSSALLLLLTSPLWAWFAPRRWLATIRVLVGYSGWVGYHPGDPNLAALPRLRHGVTYPGRTAAVSDPQTLHRLNLLYARDYRVYEDLRMLWGYLTTRGYDG